MGNKSVLDRVLLLVGDYVSRVPTPGGLTPSCSLVKDLCMDSLELMAVRTAMESEFDVHIPDDIMSEISTVGELSEFIDARLTALGNQS